MNKSESSQAVPRRAGKDLSGSRRFDPKRVDGLKLARKLAYTRSHYSASVEKISLSVAFLESLTGTSGENTWVHRDGSGCLIHILPSSEGNDSVRTVSLVGSTRAIEITRQYLTRMEGNYNNSPQPKLNHEAENCESSPKKYERVDSIPSPKSWNTKIFADHIRIIVGAQAPHGIERILYPGEDSFNKSAATVLIDLFTRPELRAFHSSFALRHALEFCSPRTDIAYAARKIWSATRQAGVVPDITCFNMEIARCFRVGNATGIAWYVSEMRSTHIEPNAETWMLFLKSLQTRDNRYHFMQLPGVREAIDNELSREPMVLALIEVEYNPSDHMPDHTSDFQKTMDRAYGKHWLTVPVIHRMIENCARAKAPQTLSKVLRLAAERSIKLDIESSASIWKAVAKTGWFEDMILLLKMQPAQLDPVHQQRIIEFAFRTAWRSCLVNSCRVLWHYAASHGLIRHTMLEKVSSRLSYNLHPEEESGMKLTSRLAVCIVGTDRCNTHSHSIDSDQPAIHDLLQDLRDLTIWLPEGEARHNQMQTVHMILGRDLTAWQRFQPMLHTELTELIEQAYLLDKSWQAQDIFTTSSRRDILTQAIEITLRPVQPGATRSVSLEMSSDERSQTVSSQPSVAHSRASEATEAMSVTAFQDPIRDSGSKSRGDSGSLRCQSVRDMYFASSPLGAPTVVSTAFINLPIIDAILHYLGLARQDF